MKKTCLEYSHLGGASSATLIVRPAIATGRFYSVSLWVRVHEKDMAVLGQQIVFGLYNTYPSREDPREFSASSLFTSVTMGSGSIAPALLSSGVATAPGPYLKFALTISPSGAAVGPLYTQVSAGVVLREL